MRAMEFDRARVGLAALVTAGALAIGVSACGSNSASSTSSSGGGTTTAAAGGSGGSGQSTAKAAIAENLKVPAFTLKANKIDASKAKGKTIFNIPVSSAIPYVAATDKQMQALAATLGIKWVQFNNQGNPTQWAAGISQAIAQKADLINLDAGNDPQLVLPQLRQAKAAGIPVQVTHLYQNGTTPPATVANLISSFVTVPFAKSGELSVDYAVAQNGCNDVKSVLIIDAKEVPPSEGIVAAMKAELTKLCPGGKATVINVPVVDWGTKIAPETQSALSADPSIKWVLPIYDSMAIPAIAGIRAGGKATSVKVSSYNGTPDLLTLIKNGNIMAADMGENVNWLAYANMDQMLRTLLHQPLKNGGELTPLRVFDKSNVGEAGPPPSTGGFGTAYTTGYKALWGQG